MTRTTTRPSGASANPAELAQRIRSQEPSAIGVALTAVERRDRSADDLLAALRGTEPHAHVIGITGPAGSGKSTLVARLAANYRDDGLTVAVLAVDPSSGYSGGAILGDRIRMNALSGDTGIFIRSLATRGATGGLSRAVFDAIKVFDAARFDRVLVETVGVGQDEIDVMSVAQTIVVVSVPGLGDDIQAIKAGILEIADVHVVNKADRPGADLTASEIRESLRLASSAPDSWRPPIIRTVATGGKGFDELREALEEHQSWLTASGALELYERNAATSQIRWAAVDIAMRSTQPGTTHLNELVEGVRIGRLSPHEAAHALVSGKTQLD
ncbi:MULTISPECIES: methylmalonyl Co-A mutase-associated GTPase MeaB [unclassified Nocardioides]|uniref:methylmalonyl Co-A mutase-associated GTPase MeaB n=1 Tax=unclassified Nocardioides TaxID=2615069 RepID=UPI00005702AE|nr:MULTISPECIES: methylmalonyl Co-A mutase-associated GTPase MeaB [unclassified Nocardioides]ABL81639.1 LAO/AO transport system ATPase [Nocardioides sp. JS614]